jgi:dUTP pyrophosphatase
MQKTSPSTVMVEIHCLAHAPKQLPAYATPGSAGMDVQAAIGVPITLNPLERALVPTGLVIALPLGYECQVRARSGLAIKHGIALANGVGTIDSDYRHEVKVALVNLSNEPFTIQPGDRVAQLVIAPVTHIEWQETDEMNLVEGRSGGFGSTGVSALDPG